MFDISHLSSLERIHFIQCPACHEWIDCRDLSQVVSHHGDHAAPQIDVETAKKINEPGQS